MKYVCPRCGMKLESSADRIAPMGNTASNPFFPFCSDRCKMADLYGWLQEQYRIPAVEQDSEAGDDGPAIDSDLDSLEES